MVELSGICELLDSRSPEDGTFGGLGRSRSRSGPARARLSQLSSPQPTSAPVWGITDLAEDELLDAPLPRVCLTHDSGCPPEKTATYAALFTIDHSATNGQLLRTLSV